MGNLLNRALGVVLGLALIEWIGPLMVTLDPNPARAVADFHTLFNLVMAVLFLPLLGPFARLLVQCDAAGRAVAYTDPSQAIYLDLRRREDAAAQSRSPALRARRCAWSMCSRPCCAARFRNALDRGDRKQVSAETKRLDDVLDRLDTAIKEYLTALDPDSLDDRRTIRRLAEILAFTTNLEHAGDIVRTRPDRARLQTAEARAVSFSVEGQAEIRAMFERLDQQSARGGGGVHDRRPTRGPAASLAEEEVFRDLETRATEDAFRRASVPAGSKAVETSALHLDALRDLKPDQHAPRPRPRRLGVSFRASASCCRAACGGARRRRGHSDYSAAWSTTRLP